jgi:dCMP deaminase
MIAKLSRFLPVAQAIASLSKDESTKVGAVVLGEGFEIRSTGWNGAPRGSDADVDERRLRPAKYAWVAHSEANAIAQAARVGTPLAGCTMVVTHAPCMSCAKLIVQAGITRVVAPTPSADLLSRWADDLALAQRLFDECGVEFILLEGESANQS